MALEARKTDLTRVSVTVSGETAPAVDDGQNGRHDAARMPPRIGVPRAIQHPATVQLSPSSSVDELAQTNGTHECIFGARLVYFRHRLHQLMGTLH